MFVGFMFLGIKICFLVGNVPVGTLIGMGVGFIAQKFYKRLFWPKIFKENSWIIINI
jgi:hypothetical protein